MNADVVVAGVGGQGALSAAHLLADSAHRAGLFVLQGELHGMSQRRGAVQAIVRISDQPIGSPQVDEGRAHLILGMEPVEALRNLPLLSPQGRLLSSIKTEEDMPGYPGTEDLMAELEGIPGSVLLDAPALARGAGAPKAASVVMLGAAAALLGLPRDAVEATIAEAFAAKGERAVQGELRALDAGWAAVLELQADT